jgi:hypothetical protein
MKVLKKKKKKHHGMAVFTANESTIKQQTEVPAAITMAATNWRTCGSAARRQAAGCRQTRTASCRGGYSDWQSSQVKTTRSELPAQSPDSRHRPAHPVQEMLTISATTSPWKPRAGNFALAGRGDGAVAPAMARSTGRRADRFVSAPLAVDPAARAPLLCCCSQSVLRRRRPCPRVSPTVGRWVQCPGRGSGRRGS